MTRADAKSVASGETELRWSNWPRLGILSSNDPTSATRPTRAFACNLDVMAWFAAAHS